MHRAGAIMGTMSPGFLSATGEGKVQLKYMPGYPILEIVITY